MACRHPLAILSLLAAVLAAWLLPAPAHARSSGEPSFAPICHAASGMDVGFSAMIEVDGWNCDGTGWQADQPVSWLWFDAESWRDEERPRFFFSRIARFESMTFAALDGDGTLRTVRRLESDGDPFAAGPVFQLELPEVTAETLAVLVRVERPHSVPLLTEARLTHHSEDADWSQLDVMLLALVIGMLILPLAFDVTFFIVLREKFVALHAGMVLAMMTYVATAGGLVSVFVDLPIRLLAVLAPFSWAIGCGLSALFLSSFLEKDALSRPMRKLTRFIGFWTMLLPGFFALQLHATQAFDDRGYFITFISTIIIITTALVSALIRGSRSARFIAAAWAPIIAASLERMARGFGLYVGPSSLDQVLYVATGIEVIMISLAIADRFLALRRERDAALSEARMLEHLSESDPLTGLINRRVIKERFAHWREQGFDTFALVDLDRFKDINDRYGHQVGDSALVACANAIRSEESRDVLAARLGGEEFVIMLRGPASIARAEALRRAITMRIASDVPGLDRPVTASMGVIEVPRSSVHLMSLEDFYARADQLLYEAKATGRNRMRFERLTVFGAKPGKNAAQGLAA